MGKGNCVGFWDLFLKITDCFEDAVGVDALDDDDYDDAVVHGVDQC